MLRFLLQEDKYMREVLYAIIISILFVGGITAQSAPPSIFVYESSQGGTKAEAAASSLEMQIFDGLFKKYPCMDLADKQGIVAMLGYQRMQELLGTAEPNEELLRELGGAGAWGGRVCRRRGFGGVSHRQHGLPHRGSAGA